MENNINYQFNEKSLKIINKFEELIKNNSLRRENLLLTSLNEIIKLEPNDENLGYITRYLIKLL